MFENITTTTVLLWVLGWLANKYLIPRIVGTDTVKKAIKVVDRETDVVESADAEFNWEQTKPAQYRPFKPIYHLTMGIAKTKESDYLRVENTYRNVVEYKARITDEEPSETCLVSKDPEISKKDAQATVKAVDELYDYVVKYVTRKYPAYFVATGNVVTNMITNKQFPRFAAKRDPAKHAGPRELLKLLCANIEEDFLIMQEDPKQNGEYALRAATGVGANGFRTSEKMNKCLTDVHKPVPEYIERLQFSMNRHFHKVRPGDFVQRLTWGIQIGGGMEQMFRPSGQHLSSDEAFEEVDGATLDFEKEAFVRVERQVLTRLPKSKFIVLSVRTYMYSLAELKREEGTAPALAKAIRGFPEDMAHYKGRPKWGKAVLAYLEN